MSKIYDMQKEECVGHIQKRMGAALRKFVADNKGQKLMDGKPVGGKGRLTKEKINKMQNYYGMAICNNPEDQAKMQNDIWAIFHHMIKADHTPLQEQHKYCPKIPIAGVSTGKITSTTPMTTSKIIVCHKCFKQL